MVDGRRHFEWNKSGGQLYLFIVHDNPMLGSTVGATTVASVSADGASTGGQGMSVMLESKDEAGLSMFIIAQIIFSGAMSGIRGANPANSRGSQCMICTGLKAIRARLKDFTTRSRPGHGDIREIDFGGLPAECYVDVSDAEKLRKFLQPCASRVDVILDRREVIKRGIPTGRGLEKWPRSFVQKESDIFD